MDANLQSLLDDLKDERASIIASMSSDQGWSATDDHVRDLTNIHTAILAVEAVMADGEDHGEDDYPFWPPLVVI